MITIYICIYKVSQSIISHITTQIFEALQVIIGEAIMWSCIHMSQNLHNEDKTILFPFFTNTALRQWTQHLLGLVSEDLKG